MRDTPKSPQHLKNTLTAENKAHLMDFVAQGDRREPFVFVGREDILQDIEQQLRQTRQAGRSVQNARVLHGPPGSGKSSVLLELEGIYKDNANILPVHLAGNDLTNQVKVAKAFVKACGVDPEVLHQEHTTRLAGSFSIAWVGVNIEKGRSEASPSDQLLQGSADTWSIVKRYLELPAQTVFLVLVDEAQRVERDRRSENNAVLLDLFDGRTGEVGCMAVFAGLSDTSAQLKLAGASPRLVSDGLRQVGPLEKDNVRALVGAFLTHAAFGLDALPLDHDAIADVIVAASDCYPRHVQSYLRGLAKEFGRDEAQIDISKALDRGRAFRVDFYKEIVGDAELDEFADALSLLTKRTPANEDFRFYDITKIAEDELGMSREDAKRSFMRAIHCGLIERHEDGASLAAPLKFSVPSFRTYASTGFDKTRTLKLLRELEESATGTF